MKVSELIAKLQKLPQDELVGTYKLSMVPAAEWVFMQIKTVERRRGKPARGVKPKQFIITDEKLDQTFVVLDSANPFG